VNRLMNYLLENCCGGQGCKIDVTELAGVLRGQKSKNTE